VGLTQGLAHYNFVDTKLRKGMNRTKHIEKTTLDDEVIFVSPEGIKSLETAIENLEFVHSEVEKAAKKYLDTLPAQT
jgi:hypothetical protein